MLPNPIAPQTLAGLKVENPNPSHVYETAKATIDAHNKLLAALGPGTPIDNRHFTGSPGLTVTSVNGTVKRGKFSAKMGSSPAANRTIFMQFPKGSFNGSPFSQIIRNGGNGASDYSYTESPTGVTITIASPLAGEEYGFQFANIE